MMKNESDTPTYAANTKSQTSDLNGERNEKNPGGSLFGFLYKIAIPTRI